MPSPNHPSPASTATTSGSRSRKRRPSGLSPDSGSLTTLASASAGTGNLASAGGEQPESGASRRKLHKVSRACDFCKLKKLRCTGTLPCQVCTKRGLECLYDARYRRGRPPTPTPAAAAVPPPPGQLGVASSSNSHAGGGGGGGGGGGDGVNKGNARARGANGGAGTPVSNSNRDSCDPSAGDGLPSRGSPELDTAEIEGQFFDLTSNLTFLRRAWKRLAVQKGAATVPGVLDGSESMQQPLMSAGDRPFAYNADQPVMLPDRQTALDLLEFYFDRCVVTYRCLNRQYCMHWLDLVLINVASNLPFYHDVGHAKAALVLEMLAIASLRQEKIAGNWSADDGGAYCLRQSDQYFCAAVALTTEEKGLPRLESVQARILQVLYLLQTARMNQAWYVFGSVVPLVSALGLHRKSGRSQTGASRSPTTDYIISQCRKRTFWVVYTIDKYLAVVFGRPRLCHDDDIDQEYPDPVNDEDMTPSGPSPSEPSEDCHVDSLIFHAKVARIVDNISREVYSLKHLPKHERLAAAQKCVRSLHEWREALPPHLGTVRPRSLIPSFRRQAMALKMAYCHAVMHAYRPFLLNSSGPSGGQNLNETVSECIGAAKLALETVDGIVSDGTLFHALWWMPYVTFCALAVVYVWEIQQKNSPSEPPSEDPSLFELADRCQNHLAQATASDSPSRRYSVILEELRLEARYRSGQLSVQPLNPTEHLDAMAADVGGIFQEPGAADPGAGLYQSMPPMMLTEWQAADWLDLDSSVFAPFPDFEGSPVLWMPDVG